MNRVIVILLAAVFAVAGLTAQKATAQATQEKKTAAAKEARWHGRIVMMDKNLSTLEVRREGTMKTIYYDSSTKWTEGTKGAEMGEFKEGADVICLGTYDEKGKFHATRIDLRSR